MVSVNSEKNSPLWWRELKLPVGGIDRLHFRIALDSNVHSWSIDMIQGATGRWRASIFMDGRVNWGWEGHERMTETEAKDAVLKKVAGLIQRRIDADQSILKLITGG